MAQVSVQYALKNALQEHHKHKLECSLHDFSGIKAVHMNEMRTILCVDYDEVVVDEETLEKFLKENKYEIELLDKITF